MIENRIRTKTIINAKTIAAGGTHTPTAYIDLNTKYIDGEFSIQILLAGDGIAKIEYLLSNDGSTFIDPTGAADIVTGFTKTSGRAGTGTDLIPVNLTSVSGFLNFKVTETGGADSITITVVLVYK